MVIIMQEKEQKIYVAIDLKSFYASVECRERGLDPMTTNLVVADPTRTEKTICLAVTPALKKYGIPGRARLYEVIQKAKAANVEFNTIKNLREGSRSAMIPTSSEDSRPRCSS